MRIILEILNVIVAIIFGLLTTAGVSLFGILILNANQNRLGTIICIIFVGIGLYIGFIIAPGPDSGCKKYSASEYTRTFNSNENLFKKGTIRIWGDWRGRNLNKEHEIDSITFSENKLTVLFKNQLFLIISNPGIILESKTFLKVFSADSVSWNWKESKSKRELYFNYKKCENEIITETNSEWKSVKMDIISGMDALLMLC